MTAASFPFRCVCAYHLVNEFSVSREKNKLNWSVSIRRNEKEMRWIERSSVGINCYRKYSELNWNWYGDPIWLPVLFVVICSITERSLRLFLLNAHAQVQTSKSLSHRQIGPMIFMVKINRHFNLLLFSAFCCRFWCWHCKPLTRQCVSVCINSQV